MTQSESSMAYKTLLVEESGGVLLVTLNRPEVHNAFNEELIAEAIDLFRTIDAVPTQGAQRAPDETGLSL